MKDDTVLVMRMVGLLMCFLLLSLLLLTYLRLVDSFILSVISTGKVTENYLYGPLDRNAAFSIYGATVGLVVWLTLFNVIHIFVNAQKYWKWTLVSCVLFPLMVAVASWGSLFPLDEAMREQYFLIMNVQHVILSFVAFVLILINKKSFMSQPVRNSRIITIFTLVSGAILCMYILSIGYVFYSSQLPKSNMREQTELQIGSNILSPAYMPEGYRQVTQYEVREIFEDDHYLLQFADTQVTTSYAKPDGWGVLRITQTQVEDGFDLSTYMHERYGDNDTLSVERVLDKYVLKNNDTQVVIVSTMYNDNTHILIAFSDEDDTDRVATALKVASSLE